MTNTLIPDPEWLKEFIRENVRVSVSERHGGDYYNPRGRTVSVELQMQTDDGKFETFASDSFSFTEGEAPKSYY